MQYCDSVALTAYNTPQLDAFALQLMRLMTANCDKGLLGAVGRTNDHSPICSPVSSSCQPEAFHTPVHTGFGNIEAAAAEEQTQFEDFGESLYRLRDRRRFHQGSMGDSDSRRAHNERTLDEILQVSEPVCQ